MDAFGRPDPLVPRLLGCSGSYLWLERCRGIRLYDLVRLLQQDPGGCGSADAVIRLLLARSRQRLQRLQRHLDGWQGPAGLHPYPLARKLAGLLRLLSRSLDLAEPSPELRLELRALQHDWRHWAVLPFRDATSKNVLVLHPDLDPSHGDRRRLDWLAHRLHTAPLESWHDLPMRDVDFSSLLHTTVPEDDPISLLAHQRTLPFVRWSPESFSLLPERFGIHPARASLGLIVRWFRFGGRKLAYRLVHPQASLQRFRHDDPLPYFTTLRSHANGLDPGLELRYPHLLERLEAIGEAYRRIRAHLPLQPDPFLLRFPGARIHWRESPLQPAPADG